MAIFTSYVTNYQRVFGKTENCLKIFGEMILESFLWELKQETQEIVSSPLNLFLSALASSKLYGKWFIYRWLSYKKWIKVVMFYSHVWSSIVFQGVFSDIERYWVNSRTAASHRMWWVAVQLGSWIMTQLCVSMYNRW